MQEKKNKMKKCCKKSLVVGSVFIGLGASIAIGHLKNTIIVTSEVVEKEINLLKGVTLKVKLKFSNNSIINFNSVGFKGGIYVGTGDKLTNLRVAPFELKKGEVVEKTITLRISWGEIVEEISDLLKGDLSFDDSYLQGFIKVTKLNVPIPYFQNL